MPLSTLPLVLIVVLLELAVGGAFVLWALDRTRLAPGGFLKVTAAVNAAAGVLAFLLLPVIPRGSAAEAAALKPGALDALAQAVPVLFVLLIAQLVTTFLPFRPLRAVIGAATIIGGGLTLMAATVARPSDAPYDVFALLALPLGALALGGVDAAMLLGHWYLVTPKLSPKPLQRAALIAAAAVLLQAGIVAVTLARGQLLGTLESTLVVPIAIRIGVGLLMTFALVLAAWWTARMNTQSSTGLLYVALGTVIAGEVAARVVYYLTGVPL
ncbi:MAG: hypothetical protein HYX56_06335 [Chloroflexi bacterium]|nr:hypothetical protein [Chloroflexota bacterium]